MTRRKFVEQKAPELGLLIAVGPGWVTLYYPDGGKGECVVFWEQQYDHGHPLALWKPTRVVTPEEYLSVYLHQEYVQRIEQARAYCGKK